MFECHVPREKCLGHFVLLHCLEALILLNYYEKGKCHKTPKMSHLSPMGHFNFRVYSMSKNYAYAHSKSEA